MFHHMLKHFGVLLVFCLIAFFITYPLIFNLGSLAVAHGDELVISWIQNWVIHALLHGNILSIFEANLYYPFHNSLAFSDTFFVSSIISMLPVLFVGEPIVAHNVTLILSLIFLGFSIYLLAYYLIRSLLLSMLVGTMVVFSPAVLSNVTHVQMLAIAGFPLAILFFLIFLEKKQTKYLMISLSFFVLQTYNSFLPGYFIVFSYMVIIIFHWFLKRSTIKKLLTIRHGVIVLLAFLLLLPIILPYYQVSKEFNYVRDLRDAIHFALQPEDLFYPSTHTRLSTFLYGLPFNQYSQNNEFKPGYIGFVFSMLSVLAFICTIKTIKKSSIHLRSFITLGLVGFMISLGPVLHLGRQTIHEPFPIPLPYILFYYLLPGFQGFRNSARWEMVFILAMAIAIALVLHQILKKYSPLKQRIIYMFLFVTVIAEFNFPMQFVPMPQREAFPKLYSWLQTIPEDAAIIHLPIYNWGWWPYTQEELWREYYGTLHFRKTVNGYTGFSPPPWQKIVTDVTANFPSDHSVNELKQLGVQYIIVHTDEYDICNKSAHCGNQKMKNGKQVIDKVQGFQGVSFVKRFDNTYVYKIK